ncbi:MAG: GNAT family N-acetyltransferase [Jatrophihabitantaceae bacterium]
MLERSWVGRRVSVRRELGHGANGRALFGDVVGDLLAVQDEHARIQTRHATVDVALADVAIARLVPPSTADELALEAVAAAGWRAEQTGALGGWLLRAADGCTARANSVLPLHAPGLPLDEALRAARSWYAERGLPLRLQVPCEARRLLDAELAERGWAASPDVHVLTARLDTLPEPATSAAAHVGLAPEPDDAWLAHYRNGAGLAPAARRLLTRHDRVVFASLVQDGGTAAIGRGVLDDGWLGVSAVAVDPSSRRHGLARAIMAALHAWGAAHAATRAYLQVSADNPPALALYEGLGYLPHHDYRYRLDPGAEAVPITC